MSSFVNLSKKSSPQSVGRYIPNLIAEPFEVTKEYAQIIYDQTSSRFDEVLRKRDEEDWGSIKQCRQLTHVIPIELLAY